MHKPLIAALAVGFTALAFASPALSMPSTPPIEHGQIERGRYRRRRIGTVIGAMGTAIADIRMDMDIGPTVTTGPMHTVVTRITRGYYGRPGISLGFAW